MIDWATHVVLVEVVVHTASATDSSAISALIEALGQRRKSSGEETYFVHVSLSRELFPISH